MLAVNQAQEGVLSRVQPGPVVSVPVAPPALGLVLAEGVYADRDSPPFTKALVDGYALRAGDASAPGTELEIVEEILAGRVPVRGLQAGQASRIMTGAPLPPGADAVMMHERTTLAGNRVTLLDAARAGQNLLRQGDEMTAGAEVLACGQLIGPAVLGLLATVGRTEVAVHAPPEVAILSTGDELVEPGESPGPGQIRNSNATLLAGMIASQRGRPRYLGIARDSAESLRPLILAGLEADFLLLSGGVSAGKLDLVPALLAELGVEIVFHKVAMKPGKPVLFGTRGRTRVFGLPGNPVGSLVAFELFVRPALRRWLGHRSVLPTVVKAELTTAHHHRSDRPTWYPARVQAQGASWLATPLRWRGSADLKALATASGLLMFPPGERDLLAGSQVEVQLMEVS